MNKSNTTAKGDIFEKKVFELLEALLENEDFFVPGKRSKIFWKKAYYSELKRGDIIVDISIETFLPKADHYSQLTIIECKNYDTNVPISDIREFSSILNELGTHNTKGIVISSSFFQSGAYQIAVSTGMGLAILKGKNELEWINYRVDRRYAHYSDESIITRLSKNNSQNNFFAYFEKNSFENLPGLLLNLGVIDNYNVKQEFINIPYISEEQILGVINQLPFSIYKNEQLETSNLCKILSDKSNVEFIFDSCLDSYNHNNVLGKITFNPLKIFITKELNKDIYRWRFTLAHEVGHLLLHSEILREYINDNFDVENTIFLNHVESKKINKRMEIQANIFATNLLLPKFAFLKIVSEYFIKERIHRNYLFLDNQPCNRYLVYNLLGELKCKFGVSHEVAKNRLVSMKLLKDETDTSISNVMRNY